MTTVRDICTRALRRIGVTDRLDSPAAEDAETALTLLNTMMRGWEASSVDIQHQTFTLDNTFRFFVPPKTIKRAVLSSLDYRGTWDADANSPALASATGTKGHMYEVSTAGSTTLDDVTSWSVSDYLVFDGSDWLKGQSSAQFEDDAMALLALKLCPEFGIQPSAQLIAEARRGWRRILSRFVFPDDARFDTALTDMPAEGGRVGQLYDGT